MKEEINKVVSLSGLKEVKINKMKEWKEEEYRKIRSDLIFILVLEGQKINQKDLGLAKQNSELLDFNKKLNQKLETVVKELNVLKKEREEKVVLKEARANRKGQPITSEIYQLLIQAARSPSYTSVRFCNWNSNYL